MSSLDHRLQRLEVALNPRSKGHRIVIGVRGGDGLAPLSDALPEEEAKQEVVRLRQEGREVTLVLFGATE